MYHLVRKSDTIASGRDFSLSQCCSSIFIFDQRSLPTVTWRSSFGPVLFYWVPPRNNGATCQHLWHEFLWIFSKLLHDWDHDRMTKNRQYKHIFQLTNFSHDIPNHHIQTTLWMSWTSITCYLNIHNMFCSHFQITTRNYPSGNVDDHNFRLPVTTVTLYKMSCLLRWFIIMNQ